MNMVILIHIHYNRQMRIPAHRSPRREVRLLRRQPHRGEAESERIIVGQEQRILTSYLPRSSRACPTSHRGGANSSRQW